MATTQFLSRLIGLAALILSVAMFVDRAPMIAAIDLMAQDPAALLLLGIAGIVAGLAIVLTHNVWKRGVWPLVVTLVGWLILIRGILMVTLPAELIARIYAAVHLADYYYLYAVLPLALGAYLTWRGFSAIPAPPLPRAAAPTPPPAPKPAKPKAPAQPGGGGRPQRRRR
ncbi:MAG TPA: hypothetical protein VND87_05945 [Stellaceae bacterium]|nr:hypothetical protein [Stellaceae bacterium]